jgi:hypothetical protein
MHYGLPSRVAVALVREQHEPGHSAMPFEGRIISLRLHRERPSVIVVLAMDQKQGLLYFVSMPAKQRRVQWLSVAEGDTFNSAKGKAI